MAVAVTVAIVVLAVLIPFVTCEDEAEAARFSADEQREARRQKIRAESERRRQEWESREREREERWAKQEAEAEARRASLQAEAERGAEKRERERRERLRSARDRLWLLKSPAAIREALWAIPREGGHEEEAEALLRICVSEAGWRSAEALQDCVWIWQVVQNVRSRSCSTHYHREFMTCNGDEETNLSAMRRLAGGVLDESKARSARQRFISHLDLSCERPLHFPRGDSWERNLKAPCERMAREVRAIVRLKGDRRLTGGAIPIAWGGRCEDSRGACDDELACRRGLARIETKTANAFWCRPGTVGCSPTIDPVCTPGGGRRPVVDSPHDTDGRDHSGRQEMSSGSPGTDLGRPQDDIRREEEHMEAGASS